MEIQRIENGSGNVNLDLYPVHITNLPEIPGSGGQRFDAPGLLEHIRLHLNDFVSSFWAEFKPYAAGLDDVRWMSPSPLGAVYKIDIAGFDDAAVVGSLVESTRWRFSTIWTPENGEHPVSGHREVGFTARQSGDLIFHSRGADRSTSFLETVGSPITFLAQDRLWKSFQERLVHFIKTNHGAAEATESFAKPFNWNLLQILLRLRPGENMA
jgi:hypothetical protein